MSSVLETFINKKLNQTVQSSTSHAEICTSCLGVFEEYDKICLEAAKIQEEIANTFNANQQKLLDDSEDLLQCKACFAQCANFEEFNAHDCILDNDDGYEIEYDDDMSQGESSKSPKKKPTFYFTCNICNESFEKRREYQTHAKLSHLPKGTRVFRCSLCEGQFFVTEKELELHHVLCHPKDPASSVFTCPICAKSFSTKALLSRHFGIHSSSSERPHVCDK